MLDSATDLFTYTDNADKHVSQTKNLEKTWWSYFSLVVVVNCPG